MPHLPLFTMSTYIHLFLSYFCFFWPQNDLFFYALSPILCHFLRTLILTVCCSAAQLCLTLSTPWTAALQASLSFTISWSLLNQICPLSQWCHPTISSSVTPSFLLSSILPSLFQWVSFSHQVAKVLELQLQHQSFQWIFRVDFL